MKQITNSAALLLVGLAACTGASSKTREEASKQAVVAHDPQQIEVRTKDYSFTAPDTVDAGVTTIRLFNDGTEMHHVWLVRMEEGKSMNDLLAAMQKSHNLPDWAVQVGGPNAPGAPGSASTATLNLEAGNYLMMCVIPSKDGMPHVMKGMMKPLTVVDRGSSDTVMPAADIVMTLDDYKFDTNVPITGGKHTIRIENAATQPHEVLFVKLAPGKTVNEALAWLEKPNGPPPAAPIAGITAINRGEVNVVTADFTPGEYGLICFWPDVKDGKPHFMHGMVKQFTI